MELAELYLLVKRFYGYKARMLYEKTSTKEVACVLYDSFLLKCDINDTYGRFGAGIVLGETYITNFLGKKCSLNSDEESIRQSLQIVDDYCRLRLPDKFLQAYDEAYKK